MTGDEFASTATDVTEVVLPEMRRHAIRYVQIGCNRLHTTAGGDGITVFSDTTAPTVLHIGVDCALSDEMLSAGTTPQLGGATLARYAVEPAAGARALFIKSMSRCA